MIFRKVAILATTLCLISCATIMGESKYPVSIESTPSQVGFSIKDEDGKVISQGKTPAVITLESSNGYFEGADYVVEFINNDGTKRTADLESSLEGWYFGNLLIGGLIGMLIVDPLTGAMYTLPKSVNVDFPDSNKLKVDTTDNLTPEQKQKLVPLK